MENRALHVSRARLGLVLSLGLAWGLAVESRELGGTEDDSYRAEIESWHRDRIERLTAEDGWLTLIGLFWLEEGSNPVGSAPSSRVRLPEDKAPGRVGQITLRGDQLAFEIAAGAVVRHDGDAVSTIGLRPDSSGSPTVLELGDLRFFAIERSGRFGVRVRDRAHPARSQFVGVDRFATEPGWRITARLERYDPPKAILIPTVLGTIDQQPSPGSVVFEVDGQTHRLDALSGSQGRLFLIFSDRTSGRETYGGGRFLYSEPVDQDDSVVVDFNKAHNPPCAFTEYATCPLPPRQNKLAVPIEAGEQRYPRQH